VTARPRVARHATAASGGRSGEGSFRAALAKAAGLGGREGLEHVFGVFDLVFANTAKLGGGSSTLPTLIANGGLQDPGVGPRSEVAMDRQEHLFRLERPDFRSLTLVRTRLAVPVRVLHVRRVTDRGELVLGMCRR
jgi:hypothetical protein